MTEEKGSELLETLAKFRKVSNKVNFGWNFLASGEGIVEVENSVMLAI